MAGIFVGSDQIKAIYHGADPIIKVYLGSTLIADFTGVLVPGQMPAFGAAGAVTDSATLAATHAVAYPSGVTAGQFLMVIAAWRHNDGNGAYTMHADMVADGWAEMTGSPFKRSNGNDGCHIFWKIATDAHAGSIPGGVVGSGGASSDQAGIVCVRFPAADGFKTNPIESISSLVQHSNTTNLDMPTVTTSADRRLAVAVTVFNNDLLSLGSTTGESGGDWTEAADLEASAGGDLTIQIQTAQMASAGSIAGGSRTSAVSGGGITIGFALAPADVAA